MVQHRERRHRYEEEQRRGDQDAQGAESGVGDPGPDLAAPKLVAVVIQEGDAREERDRAAALAEGRNRFVPEVLAAGGNGGGAFDALAAMITKWVGDRAKARAPLEPCRRLRGRRRFSDQGFQRRIVPLSPTAQMSPAAAPQIPRRGRLLSAASCDHRWPSK